MLPSAIPLLERFSWPDFLAILMICGCMSSPLASPKTAPTLAKPCIMGLPPRTRILALTEPYALEVGLRGTDSFGVLVLLNIKCEMLNHFNNNTEK